MEDVEGSIQLVIHVQDRGNVAASIAVVRSRPNSDEVLVSEPVLESVHHKLMGSGDQGNVVDVIELGGHLGSEEPSSASWGHSPSFNIFWVGPHEIAEWTLVRDLHSSVDESDLVNGFDLRGKSSMDAENFSLHNGADAEIIENLGAVLPRVGISVLSNGLIVEAVHGGDLSGLVVSSEQGDVRWVLELQAQEELEGLHGVETSVDKVAHENVSRIWNLTALIEKFQEVVELAVDISANGHWRLHWLHVALLDQDLLHLLAQDSQLSFWQDGTVLDGLKPIIDDVLTHFSLHSIIIYFND
jgi:hypothetical protein